MQTKEFKTAAIDIARELEKNGYNRYAMKAFSLELADVPNLHADVLECWLNSGIDFAERAALALIYYEPQEVKKNIKKSFFARLFGF